MKIMYGVLFTSVLAAFYLLFWPSEKDHLNTQMAELCKIDGGFKVYERVKLPAGMFDESGNLKNRQPVKDNGQYVIHIGSEYILYDEVETLKDGDLDKNEGRLFKIHTIVRQTQNNKIVAESIAYRSSGGGQMVCGDAQRRCMPQRYRFV
jgi:hypothetical protein